MKHGVPRPGFLFHPPLRKLGCHGRRWISLVTGAKGQVEVPGKLSIFYLESTGVLIRPAERSEQSNTGIPALDSAVCDQLSSMPNSAPSTVHSGTNCAFAGAQMLTPEFSLHSTYFLWNTAPGRPFPEDRFQKTVPSPIAEIPFGKPHLPSQPSHQ